MGVAVINEDTCLSFQGMRCEVCYRACPLIDEAIRIDYRPREGDAIHAVFAPQVMRRWTVPGCGLCEQRCPVSDPAPAIVVVPTGAPTRRPTRPGATARRDDRRGDTGRRGRWAGGVFQEPGAGCGPRTDKGGT